MNPPMSTVPENPRALKIGVIAGSHDVMTSRVQLVGSRWSGILRNCYCPGLARAPA